MDIDKSEHIDMLKSEFKSKFKSNGVKLKGINVNWEDDYNDIAFIFSRNVQYLIRWFKRTDYAVFSRIERDDIPSDIDDIEFDETNMDTSALEAKQQIIRQPNIANVSEAISKDYKEYMKQKSLIQRIISKIVNENA